MASYRMVYGDEEQVVRETFHDVDLEREDGWTVVFRGKEASPATRSAMPSGRCVPTGRTSASSACAKARAGSR